MYTYGIVKKETEIKLESLEGLAKTRHYSPHWYHVPCKMIV